MGKTCLVPRSDEFESQGQRSKVKVTRNKKRAVHALRSPPPPAATEWNALAANNGHAAADGTIPSMPGVISAACVRFMFGKNVFGSSVFACVCLYPASLLPEFVSKPRKTKLQIRKF